MVAKCPTCGNRLWQIILDDPADNLDHCPKCGRKMNDDAGTHSESTRVKNQGYLSQQFDSINSTPPETKVDPWPVEFAEYFPGSGQPLPDDEEPEWVSELNGEERPDHFEEQISQDENDFSDREREEAHQRMLRSHGYGIDVDSQGLRLTNTSAERSKKSSALSPYDVVRLASELEGGVVPVEERIHCPACEAVILPTDKICSWCSAPLA